MTVKEGYWWTCKNKTRLVKVVTVISMQWMSLTKRQKGKWKCVFVYIGVMTLSSWNGEGRTDWDREQANTTFSFQFRIHMSVLSLVPDGILRATRNNLSVQKSVEETGTRCKLHLIWYSSGLAAMLLRTCVLRSIWLLLGLDGDGDGRQTRAKATHLTALPFAWHTAWGFSRPRRVCITSSLRVSLILTYTRLLCLVFPRSLHPWQQQHEWSIQDVFHDNLGLWWTTVQISKQFVLLTLFKMRIKTLGTLWISFFSALESKTKYSGTELWLHCG